MANPPGVSVSAASLRGIGDQLKKSGRFEAVSKRLTEPTRSLLAKPPMPTTYVDVKKLNEIVCALGEEGGPDVVLQTGREMARGAYGVMVPRMIRFLVGMFGGGPQTVFAHAQKMFGMFEKGTTYTWRNDGDRAGTMTIGVAEPFPPVCFSIYEGIFAYLLESQAVQGEVAGVIVADDGRTATLAMRW